jgi:hypothetical protein
MTPGSQVFFFRFLVHVSKPLRPSSILSCRPAIASQDLSHDQIPQIQSRAVQYIFREPDLPGLTLVEVVYVRIAVGVALGLVVQEQMALSTTSVPRTPSDQLSLKPVRADMRDSASRLSDLSGRPMTNTFSNCSGYLLEAVANRGKL